MKRQLLLLLTGLLLCSLSLFAKNVDTQKALLVASNFSKQLHSPSLRSEGASLKLAYTAKPSLRSAGPETYYYVFNIGENEGYIIISGDDCARPVLGYSKSNAFDINQIPDNMKSWLTHYQEQIAYAASNSTPSPEAEAEWNKLQSGTALTTLRSVVDLKTANWGQSEPYNAQCNGNLSGCVATAMAIVMKYHEWPVRGTGSHTIPNTQYSANFDKAYDWNNMAQSYPASASGRPPAYTQAQAEAVATLMYHCAVSIDADFGTEATSAYMDAPEKALSTYFGYDRNVEYKDKKQFSNNTAWEGLLKAEIDAKRPVIYGGQSIYGGHSFVCDGYDNSDKYQINWGWNGYCNGTFALTALIPSEENPDENYSTDECMIIHIQKSTETPSAVKYSGLQMTDRGNRVGMTSDKENVSKGDPFSIEAGTIQNTSQISFSGKIAIALTTADNQMKEIITNSKELEDFGSGHYYPFPWKFDCNIKESTVEATDLIRIVTNTTPPYSNLSDWEIVDAKGTQMTSSIKAKGHQIIRHKVVLPTVAGVNISIQSGKNPVIHGRDLVLAITPSQSSYTIVVKANGEKILPNEYTPTHYYLNSVIKDMTLEVRAYSPSEAIESKSVTVSAGGLKAALTADELNCVKKLTITGTIDARDFLTLRDETMSLTTLDISGTTISSYDKNPANGIPESAFFKDGASNTLLQAIVFPDNLTSIKSNAFMSCTALDKVVIPAKVSSYGVNVFNACRSLTNVTVKNPEPAFINWCVFSGSNRANGTLTVPAGSKAKYQAASEWNLFSSIVEAAGTTYKVTLPTVEGVTITPESGFDADTIAAGQSFKFKVIPDNKHANWTISVKANNIVIIPDQNKIYTIQNIQKDQIVTITLSEPIVKMYPVAYQLENITITSAPDSVVENKQLAVILAPEKGYSLPEAIRITMGDTELTVGSGYTYSITGEIIIQTVTNNIVITAKGIPDSELEETTFTSGLLKYQVTTNSTATITGVTDETKAEYTIPSTVTNKNRTYTVTTIGFEAFQDCYNLTRFAPPASLQVIGTQAFSGCTKLGTMLLQEGLQVIEGLAFGECTSLLGIEIPASVTLIETGAFDDCSKLAKITVKTGNQQYTSSNGVLYDKNRTTLHTYPNMHGATYIIPEGVKHIGEGAFSTCTSLTAITISEGVTSIGEGAFESCTGLQSITLPVSLIRIDKEGSIFIGCEETLKEIHCINPKPFALAGEYPEYTFFYDSNLENGGLSKCKLYVPKGSKEAYAKAPGWKFFKNIIEEGEEIPNKPLVPPTPDADITISSDSTYTDTDGNSGNFNGTIGTGNEETIISKLTITGSVSATTTITLNQITVGEGSSSTEATTFVTQNTHIILELLGDNSLGRLVNDGIIQLIGLMDATLSNTSILNNGVFTDETGLVTMVEGAAGLDISAPTDQEVPAGQSVMLTASTEVGSAYSLTFTWEQLQPDGNWIAIGMPNTITPNRSGLRVIGNTVSDPLTVRSDEAGTYRCVINNKVGNVSTTLTTQPATVTVKSTVDNATIDYGTKTYVRDRVLCIHTSAPTEIQIVNFNGVIIRNFRLPAGETQINGLESGFYIIRFGDNQTVKITI